MKSILSFLFVCWSLCSVAQSQKGDLIRIMVAPASDSYEYRIGERADFEVSIFKYGKLVKNAAINYSIGAEQMSPEIEQSIVLKDGHGVIEGISLSQPGFVRITISHQDENATFTNTATAGIAVEEIETFTQMPRDFKQFWDKTIARAREIPLEPLFTRMPEKDTATKLAYHIRFNHGKKSFIYGVLTVPKKEGTYPAILHVPGAGVRPYHGTDYNDEVISLQIGIHGIPVNLYNSDIYENLKYGALYKYYLTRMEDRNRYYYNRVYTACVRAVDFIHTLENFDGENLGVTGGSQGGALTIVTAALDSRVDAIAAYYPALGDLEGFKNGRAGGWPRLNDRGFDFTEEKVKVSRYYDVVNFARLLKVPGYYGYGYNDNVVPASSIVATLNEIKASKEIRVAHDAAHWMYPEIKKTGKKWLYKTLKIKGY